MLRWCAGGNVRGDDYRDEEVLGIIRPVFECVCVYLEGRKTSGVSYLGYRSTSLKAGRQKGFWLHVLSD